MRIVFVTGDAPWPLTAGGRIRDAATFEAASAIGDVVLVSFPFAQPPDRSKLPAGTRVFPMPWPTSTTKRATQRLRATLHRRHVFQEHLIRSGALPILSDTLQDLQPDVTILGYPLFDAFPRVARAHSPRLIVDLLELRATDIGARLRTLKRPGERLRAALDALVMERVERGPARYADEIWFVTEADATRYRTWTGVATRVVPNTVDVARYAPYRAIRSAPGSIAFLGAFDNPANVQAARRLADAVLPTLRKHRADATLTLVGRRPPDDLRGLVARTAGVSLVADAADALDVLARHGPLVAPLESGTGTKLKVLEAAAAGVPIVTTPQGVASLDLRHDEEVLIAGTDADIVAAVERIWTEIGLADRLRTAALTRVTERYDQRVAAAAIGAAITLGSGPT